MTFILLFLIAHLLGDFVFQFNKIAEMKAKSVHGIVVHVLIVGVTKVLVMGVFYGFRGVILSIGVAFVHFCIDLLKLELKDRIKKIQTLYFLIDQGLHISVLVFVSLRFYIGETRYKVNNQLMLLIVLMIIAYYVLTIFVKMIMIDLRIMDKRPFFEKRERIIDGLTSLLFLGTGLYFDSYLSIIVMVVIALPYGIVQFKKYEYSYKVVLVKVCIFMFFALNGPTLYSIGDSPSYIALMR